MAWFCSGYFPRRFILADVKGITIIHKYAIVWRTRGWSWHWSTFINTFGSEETLAGAMVKAERSLDERLGIV